MLADASSLRFLLATAVLMLATGCGEPEIQSYTVPRITQTKKNLPGPVPPMMAAAGATAGKPQRMLGGILLTGKAAWFFKLTDAPAVAAAQEAAFKKFVESVRIEGSNNPTWELPEDWTALPGDMFRFATIRTGKDDDAPKLAISRLDQGDKQDEYLLANINRWRGQLQLPPWTAAEMQAGIEELKAGDFPVFYVSFETKPAPAETIQEPENHNLSFVKPAGWEQIQPKSTVNQLAFQVKSEEGLLDVTVSQFGKSNGGIVANINRWRMQLQLPEIEEDAVHAALSDIPAGLGEGKWIELTGEGDSPKAIFGAVVTGSDSTWFIKASGPAAIAEKERNNVLDFVKLLKTSS